MVKWTGDGFNRYDQSHPTAFPALGRYHTQVLAYCSLDQNHVWFVLFNFEESLCSTFESNVGANRQSAHRPHIGNEKPACR